jgi:hypothetical protein
MPGVYTLKIDGFLFIGLPVSVVTELSCNMYSFLSFVLHSFLIMSAVFFPVFLFFLPVYLVFYSTSTIRSDVITSLNFSKVSQILYDNLLLLNI